LLHSKGLFFSALFELIALGRFFCYYALLPLLPKIWQHNKTKPARRVISGLRIGSARFIFFQKELLLLNLILTFLVQWLDRELFFVFQFILR